MTCEPSLATRARRAAPASSLACIDSASAQYVTETYFPLARSTSAAQPRYPGVCPKVSVRRCPPCVTRSSPSGCDVVARVTRMYMALPLFRMKRPPPAARNLRTIHPTRGFDEAHLHDLAEVFRRLRARASPKRADRTSSAEAGGVDFGGSALTHAAQAQAKVRQGTQIGRTTTPSQPRRSSR